MAGKVPIDSSKLQGQQKRAGSSDIANAVAKKGAVKGKTAFTTEKIADLPTGFDLNAALDKAYQKVVHYMNDMLEVKDLEVHMSQEGELSIGHVMDKETGEKVSSYEGKEMLRLYSHNNQAKGIVIDGKI